MFRSAARRRAAAPVPHRATAGGARARRGLTAVLAVLAVLYPLSIAVGWAPSAAAVAVSEEQPFDANGQLGLDGGGYGHGRGLSQNGAQGAAQSGLSASSILDFYYPGTSGGQGLGQIRVKLDTAAVNGVVRVSGSVAGAVRAIDQGSNTTYASGADAYLQVRLVGGRQTLESWDGASAPKLLAYPVGSVRFEVTSGDLLLSWADGSRSPYRGVIYPVLENGSLIPVNVLPTEQYLWGVVPREVPPSWLPAALQAQSVAARTYATAYARRSPSPTGSWDICATTMCQIYGGKNGEYAATTSAVNATAGLVRTYNGVPVNAEFSASNGGFTASDGSTPYFVAKSDPYDGWSGNTNYRWSVTISSAVAARAYPGIGTPTSLRITARTGAGPWGGRVLSATIVGSSGTVSGSGDWLRSLYGLRSTLFGMQGPPQTAIMAKWSSLGGAAYLGNALGPEYVFYGAQAQDFERGSIYWVPQTGAWSVYLGINGHYRGTGGRGVWGMPLSDEHAVGAGRGSDFENGQILWSGGTGAFGVRFGMAAGWSARGGVSGLGFPTSDEGPVTGGSVQFFERGWLFWTPQRSTQAVVGAILGRYAAGGGWGTYGLPLTEEAPDAGTRVQQFADARVYWTAATGAHVVRGAIGDRFLRGGGAGTLGAPTTDEQSVAGTQEQLFTRARIYWSPARGALLVSGAVNGRYVAEGGATSLGPPTSEEQPTPTGVVQYFTAGSISWNRTTGATSVVRY